MQILILNHDEVARLLPMDACIDVMAGALAALSRGEAHLPLRTVVRPPSAKGLMGLMPSYLAGERAAYGLKAICVFPSNSAIGKDSHQGGVLLFSAETGELLARVDAGDLAILGVGVQARAHLAAMACVRPIRRARVASLRPERAHAFAAELAPQFDFPIEPTESAEQAVRDADLIVTATTAAEPIIRREWIAPGAHINAVGSSIPTAREIDTATMLSAGLFVDRRESTLNESGDYLFAAREDAIGPEHIRAEIGELLIGTRPGRASLEEITLFKSLGLAIEDLAAADYVYRRAQVENAGTWVEF